MARAIFSHELGDPDFQWLLTTFTEQHHTTVMVDAPCLPIVLVFLTPDEKAAVLTHSPIPLIPPSDSPNGDAVKEPPKD
jgi:hypothetical protein